MIVLLFVEKLDQGAVSDARVFIAGKKIESVGGSKDLDQMSDEGRFSGAGLTS
jgi:hypothetical protein